MKTKLLTSCFALAALAGSASAAVLVSDGFEGSLGNWTGSADATLYTYDGVAATNFATTGTGAVSLNTGGFNGSNPLTLTNTLALDTGGATFVTIDFDYTWSGGSSTRFFWVEYSSNGGTNWTTVGSNIAAPTAGSATRTVTTEADLTDQFLFRFVPKNDGSSVYAYLDNIEITSDSVVPEPSSFALLAGCFGLAWVMVRRRG